MTSPGREVALWCAGLARWAVAWGSVVRAEGPESGSAPLHSLLALLGLVVAGVVSAVRLRVHPWRLTVVAAALYATVFAVVLVLLSGTAAADGCTGGQRCDVEEGLGVVTGPLALALPLLAFMAVARVVALAGRDRDVPPA